MVNDPSKPDDIQPPEKYKIVYRGAALPPFYVAEMLRPYIGKTVWVMDGGGRTRNGMLKEVPWVKEDQTENISPVLFEDERPLFLRQIVALAVYDPHGAKGAK